MRRLAISAAVALSAGLGLSAGPVAAQEMCADPATFCARTIDQSCLARVGAGVEPALAAGADQDCEAQFALYRGCLGTVASECGAAAPTARATCSDATAIALYDEAKAANDCETYDAFLTACPGAPQSHFATVARGRLGCDAPAGLATADAETPRAALERRWRALEPTEDVAGMEAFVAEAGVGPLADAARARLAALYQAGQRELRRLGRYDAAIDGDWGPGSRRAMSAFQRARGAPETDGALTETRLAALRSATPVRSAPAATADYSPGSCDRLLFDADAGRLNGLAPTASWAEIDRALPCATGRTEEGSPLNYGGGVYFLDHDFYFYTHRDFIEIRDNFSGRIRYDGQSLSVRDAAQLFVWSGAPFDLISEGEPKNFRLRKPYGCLTTDGVRIRIHTNGCDPGR